MDDQRLWIFLPNMIYILRRITTGSRIQVENNFTEHKCIVVILSYVLILEQLLIENCLGDILKLMKILTISSVD